MHAVNRAHAEVDEPFGFSGSLLTLKVDELRVVPLQDEVKVLPPLAFTCGRAGSRQSGGRYGGGTPPRWACGKCGNHEARRLAVVTLRRRGLG